MSSDKFGGQRDSRLRCKRFCSQSITLQSFIKHAHSPCFSSHPLTLSSFIKLSKSKENQWTLRNTWPCSDSGHFPHTHVYPYNEKASKQPKNFVSNLCVDQQHRAATIFQVALTVAALSLSLYVCVCVSGLTGHRLKVALLAPPSLSNS